ncbi:efflux transporter outer membrane subunit [Burkholderia cenocepacia]|uniref:efflux transporter outer membrane subunit n=1 Tax=Burkholderia cenocepacia TaxID=95486 RepID=UPI001C8AF555|nr:efflux transporter outer membrane subunit [Burkholderia cenocepacia]
MKRRAMQPCLFGLGWIFFSAFLSGCMSGPDYRPPTSTSSPAGRGSFVTEAPTIDPNTNPREHWWRLYDDPALAGIVQDALAANTDLRAAEAHLRLAQSVVSEARAGRFPSTTASGGVTWGRGETSQGGAYNTDTGVKRLVEQGGFATAWELDLFGHVSRAIEAARGNAEAVEAARDGVRVAVAANVTLAYSKACALSESVQVARTSLELAHESYTLVADQRHAGSASGLDLERAGALVASAQAAVPPLEGQHRAALFELAALMGRPPSEIPAAASSCKQAPQLHKPIPVGDGTSLLRRRPDVREAERMLASDTARVGVAVAELYPRISLGGAVDYLHSGSGQFGPDLSFSIGPLVTWSFPNILVARAHIRQAQSTADADLANFDGTVLTALKETEQALAVYATDLDQQSALTVARDRSERAFHLADSLYRAGSISYLEQITAQQALTDAQAKLARSDLQVAVDRVNLFKALGGGWELQGKEAAVSRMGSTVTGTSG